MTRLLTRTSTVCEIAPRPMRLLVPSRLRNGSNFLEGHVTLLLATLEAQNIAIRTTVNIEDAPRNDVAARTNLVMALMEEIEQSLTSLSASPKLPAPKQKLKPTTARLEDFSKRSTPEQSAKPRPNCARSKPVPSPKNN